MSWLFSRALVEEYSEANSSAGEPFVQSNANHILQAYCAPDRMTKFSRLSRFGMTFAPLTEIRGEELLTLYREDFLARTSVLPDTVPVSPAVGQDSGLKWQGLLGKYDHDTRSWKTAQCSLLADLEQCLEIWPRWGLMRDGVSYQQQTLARHTSENESGLLLNTPPPSPPPLAYTHGTYEQRNERAKRAQSKHADIDGTSQLADSKNQGHVRRVGIMEATKSEYNNRGSPIDGCGKWWASEPNVGRVVNGVAARMDRLKAIGNGQVPAVAATAFRLLGGFHDRE